MSSLVTLKKRIQKLERVLSPRPEDVVTVTMWTPDGKDPPYRGGCIRIKSLNKNESTQAFKPESYQSNRRDASSES